VYSEAINYEAVMVAAGFLGVIALMGRWGAWQNLAYVFAGVGAWLAGIHSGLHPSIVGMLAGVLVVSHAPQRDALDRAAALFHAFRQSPLPSVGRSARRGLQRAVSPNERFQEILHPWTSFVIVPVFALANAGVDLRGGQLADAMASPITWGVVLGLVVGKPIGIGLAALAGVKLNLGALPRGVGPGQTIGGGALSGLGFSVSLLIADLAFDSPELRADAVIGVLVACVLSVVTGWIAFRLSARVLGERPATLSRVLAPPVDAARDHIRGRLDAPLTVVEYADFECPFCSASTNVVRELRRRFGDELRYVFRHLPLADVHPHAELAAEAVEAAGAQGRFWEMHDLLFEHQDRLEFEDLLGYAGELHLDVESFAHAISEGVHGDRVQDDAASADASGARGTPTFFIGGQRHVGAWDTESLARELEALLGERRTNAERAPRQSAGPAQI
jgi:predicted DsbA family dithiol-disulfide isomerase